MFVSEVLAGVLHCQVGDRWGKLKSGDIHAWGCQKKATVLQGWGQPGRAEMQQKEQLQE